MRFESLYLHHDFDAETLRVLYLHLPEPDTTGTLGSAPSPNTLTFSTYDV